MFLKRYKILLILVILIFNSSQILAAQKVVINISKGSSIEESKSEALEKGFAKAISDAAQTCYPNNFSKPRAHLIMDYMQPKLKRFISSYSEKFTSNVDNGGKLELTAQIDYIKLKRALTGIGIYQTNVALISYKLASKNLRNADLSTISKMEKICGVSQKGSGNLIFTAQKKADKWETSLLTPEKLYTASHEKLDSAWLLVWDPYFMSFNSQAVKTADKSHVKNMEQSSNSSVTQMANASSLVVKISGWASTDLITSFEQTLKSWGDLNNKATLQTVNMDSYELMSVWNIYTQNRQAFLSKLKEYCDSRGLTFVVE